MLSRESKVINIQMIDSSTREALGPSLARFGFLSAMLGALLNLKTTIEVARRSPPRGRHPLRNRYESLDTRRVYVEHEKFIPGSRCRVVFNDIFLGGLFASS